ncbi:MAG: TonB-dependent receptor [Bacteroidaceae bacterium]|nr:TonB-dependent receptor [Bacteroidaceae bacterium]
MKHFLPVLLALSISTQTQAQNETTVSLDDVVITGSRSAVDVRHLPTTVTVIDRETLTENEQLSLLPTLSQQVPGLFVTSRGMMGYGVSGGAAGGINLRGISGGAGQLLVLIDGHPQYQGIYGHPIADAYQTLMAERVEVLRGPASVLYGSNAMGGVINIVTRGGNASFGERRDRVTTQLQLGGGSYGTVQTEVANQARAGRFFSTFAAQYSRTDNHRPRMGFEQYGGYLKLGYDLNEHWNTYVDADLTHFNASHPGTTDSPLWDADQHITRGAVSAALENHYERTSGGVSLFTNFGRHKIDDGTSDPSTPTQRLFRSKDVLTGFNIYQSAQLFEGNRTTVGIDYQHIYGNAYYTSKSTGDILDTPNKQSGRSHRNEIAGYVDFRQDLASWLTLAAGLRLDHHSISGTEWIPQGGIVVRPTRDSELKAMASKGFRNPTMRELYLYPPSNTDLRPERLWNYELSWRQRLMGGRLTYGVNLFYIKGDNMIQTVRVDGKPRNVNTGVIENSGVEMDASWRIDDHWSVSTNHAFLHMVHRVIAAPDYAGFLGVNYRCAKFSANLGLQHINRLYLDRNGDSQPDDTDTFTLVNATLGYQLLPALRLWARGENLLAQRYEVIGGCPMPRATFMAGVNLNF